MATRTKSFYKMIVQFTRPMGNVERLQLHFDSWDAMNDARRLIEKDNSIDIVDCTDTGYILFTDGQQAFDSIKFWQG